LFGLFRKVTTVHDLYYLKFPSFVRKWQRHYWSVMIPLSMRVSDRVIAVSESTARDLCEAFPWVRDKLDTIYHGRPQAAGAGRQGADTERYVLFVGNITPNKNIETVVGAMALLRERGSDLTLRLVGRDLFGRLRQCLSTMSKPPHVELRSEVNDAELTGLYRSAFCTVIASHYEGFGFPLMEAMAYGCPVISSGAGALREIGGEAALYFKPDSAAELASNILRLDAEPALRRKLVRLAEENITRFSWDKAALAHKETFLNCLPDGAPPSTRTNSDSGHDF